MPATTGMELFRAMGTVMNDEGTVGAGTSTPDFNVGGYHKLTCSAGTRTIAAPTRGDAGAFFDPGTRLFIDVKNSSGGALTITWNSAYLQAATAPANTKERVFSFIWNGSKWVQDGVGLDV